MAAETDPNTERQRAYHEAGHAVLASRLGQTVERVSIVPMSGARSYARLPTLSILDPAEQLVVLLAGEEAQTRLDDGGPIGPGDRERAKLVLDAAKIDEAGGRQMLVDGQERARRLLAETAIWRQVEAVAEALLVEGTLDGSRFRDIVAAA